MTRNEAIEILNKVCPDQELGNIRLIQALEALGLLKVEESVNDWLIRLNSEGCKEQLIKEAQEYVDPAVVRTSDPIDKIIEMANIIGRLLLYVK